MGKAKSDCWQSKFKKYCCKSPSPFQKCHWIPNLWDTDCTENKCAADEIEVALDTSGDARADQGCNCKFPLRRDPMQLADYCITQGVGRERYAAKRQLKLRATPACATYFPATVQPNRQWNVQMTARQTRQITWLVLVMTATQIWRSVTDTATTPL